MKPAVTFVDDSSDLRALVTLLLKRGLGVECLGLNSLKEVELHSEDVLNSSMAILDVNLGSDTSDGIDVFDWLQRRNFGGAVFFLTGHARSHPRISQARNLNVQILEKPIPPDRLLALVGAAIAKGPRDKYVIATEKLTENP